MRIRREQSRLTFRRQRRRSGCGLSLAVLLGLAIGGIAISWQWIGQRIQPGVAARPATDLLGGAQNAFARGDLDASIDLARQALIENPHQAEAAALLARALVYRSYTDYDRSVDRQLALALLSEALGRSPGNQVLLAAQSYALQADGDPTGAAQVAQRVLEQNPDDVLARVSLALAYGGVGSFELALRESQQAAQSPEFQMDSQRALAITYSDLGDYQSAIQSIERAIKQNNRLVPLYFERALYALQIGDADAATAAYFQVLALDPENVKARLRLCELSSLLRERDAAINYCQQVTERAPAWAEGWYQLGREYFLQGNFSAAQNNLHRCSALQVMQDVPVSKRRFECWYLQGQAAEILGDCDGLVATYNEFREMAAAATIAQTWTYPPEGPPGCQ
ncbi:MAG: tetratricopeptide repeat protein [Anaerolineae bacterium]|nr:tetratricopeptide repeat protein [Anaerolineae bacterium]